MSILRQLTLFALFSLAAEGLSMWLPLSIPASILSMLLLFIFLALGWIKEKTVADAGDFFLNNMGIFFVPAGVEILSYLPLLKNSALPFLAVCLITMILTFATTAWTVRWTVRLQNKWESRKKKNASGGEDSTYV